MRKSFLSYLKADNNGEEIKKRFNELFDYAKNNALEWKYFLDQNPHFIKNLRKFYRDDKKIDFGDLFTREEASEKEKKLMIDKLLGALDELEDKKLNPKK